jgi:phage anti-repressor protein
MDLFGYGYEESQDYSQLSGFEKLTEEQQKQVHQEYERGYNTAKHMGIKIAMGKGHQTAKRALEKFQEEKAVKQQPTPSSIFDGLENCQ